MAKIKKNKQTIKKSNVSSESNLPDNKFVDSVFLLFLIIAFGLIIRIIALTNLSTTIYADFLLWDERIYHNWAKAIAEGTFQSQSVYEFAPLPAYIMAAVYRIFSPDILYIRILNIIFGTLTCFIVYLIARELINRKVALLACIIACIYKPFIFYSIVPLKESLALLLFAWMSYLLIKVIRQEASEPKDENRQNILRIGLLGLAVGMLLNVRPNAVVLVPVLILPVIWYGFRDKLSWKHLSGYTAVYVLGLSIALAPFVIRNYVVAGKPALTTTQSGFNLYLGNNINNPDPYYRPVPFASSSPFEQGIQFTIEASRRAGKKLTSSEASDYWTKETIRQALDNPAVFMGKVGQKILVFVNRFEACDHYDIDFLSDYAKFFKIPFPGFWIIFPLSMLGMLTDWKNRKTKALSMVLLFYGATLIIFFANGRYRLPMLAVLIPFAASGISQLYADFSKKLSGLLAKRAAICGMFLIVAFLPVRATDDTTAYYNTHAIILSSKGYINEAILYWQKSSEMNKPFSDFANLSLAHQYFRRGLVQQGNSYLDKIRDDSFAAAQKYQILGDFFTSRNDYNAAVSAYEKSISINSGQILPRRKMINIYKIHDQQKEQEELEAL
ncbi:MAG: glycosyltransferase family 39 protein, partial [Smithella sp.]|nr:glycosyltransferase family 39 protein [Smithella sp.]